MKKQKDYDQTTKDEQAPSGLGTGGLGSSHHLQVFSTVKSDVIFFREQSGVTVALFSIRFEEVDTDKGFEYGEEATVGEEATAVAYDHALAQWVRKFLKKGSNVWVDGEFNRYRHHRNQWEGQIIANCVYVLDGEHYVAGPQTKN